MKIPIEELREMIEDNLHWEMCRCCPNAKKCHEECDNCDDYEDKLEKQLRKVGLDLC